MASRAAVETSRAVVRSKKEGSKKSETATAFAKDPEQPSHNLTPM
jgi:hypothetical protein